jgi:hypothetical protein
MNFNNPDVRIIVADAETYYNEKDGYSLKKMTTQEYIEDPRFQEIMWSATVVGKNGIKGAIGGADNLFKTTDWSKTILVAHNAMFDASILNEHHDINPRHIFCTMAMAKTLGIGKLIGSVSLAALSKFFNIEDKKTYVSNMNGRRLESLTSNELHHYMDYCKTDTKNECAIFELMAPYLDNAEMLWQSTIHKMYTDPKLSLNTELLYQDLRRVIDDRAAQQESLREKLGFHSLEEVQKHLGSNNKFAALLEEYGADIPMKVSPTTGKDTFAFAKTDQGMQGLLDHDDPTIRALAETRIGVKSNTEQTRLERLIRISELPSNKFRVPHKISGAHTHRLSGTDSINCFPGDVECLTRKGWVRLDEFVHGDEVVAWDGEHLQWEKAGRVQSWTDRLIQIESHTGHYGTVCTPNHRIKLVRPDRPTTTVTAQEMLDAVNSKSKANFYLPTAGKFSDQSRKFSDEFLQLYAMCQADGHQEHNFAVNLSFSKVFKQDRCRDLLWRSEIKFSERQGDNEYIHFRIFAHQLPPIKTFCHLIKHATPADINVFITESKYWDAHRRQDSWIWFTSNEKLAVDYQTMCAITGRTATIGFSENRQPGSYGEKTATGLYRVNVRPRKHICLEAKRMPVREKYCSPGTPVYCVNVPSDAFLTKHKGRIGIFANCQNFPSGRVAGQSKALRQSIVSYNPLKQLSAPDSGQIEARILAYVCDDRELLQVFSLGQCPYSLMAEKIYKIPKEKIKKGDGLYKKTGDEKYKKYYLYRQTGKAAVLQLGYAAGAKGFYRSLRDTYGVKTVSLDECKKIHQIYVDSRRPVEMMWDFCKELLDILVEGGSGYFGGPDGKLFYYSSHHTIFGHKVPGIRLPNNTWLTYPNLHKRVGEKGYTEYAYYKDLSHLKRKPKKGETEAEQRRRLATRIWKGTVIENLCQALAFAAMKWQAVKASAETPILMNVHDEFITLADGAEALKTWMETAPPWLQGMRFECEYEVADNYGDC